MYFLPGQFNLQGNFTVRNVNNFSLIGNSDKENRSTIQCSTSGAILFYNSTNITVSGFKLKGCATYVNRKMSETSSLLLQCCSNVTVSYMNIDCLANNFGIQAVNIFGNSIIKNVTSNRINIMYYLGKNLSNIIQLQISHFKRITDNCSSKNYAINITLKNYYSMHHKN